MDMDIDDRETATSVSRRRKRSAVSNVCACLAILVALVTGFLLTKYAAKAYGVANQLIRPYARYYAHTVPGSESAAAVVVPLVDKDTRFDVVATIWRRKPCVDRDRDEDDDPCYNKHWAQYRSLPRRYVIGESRLDMPQLDVDEEVVFSERVLQDFGLHSGDQVVDLEFDLPIDTVNARLDGFNRDYAAPYDVRAAVSFIPRSLSLLDRVSHYTASTPAGMIVPPVVDDSHRPTAVDWGAEGSLRRTILDSLTVHVPLLRTRFNHNPESRGLDTYLVNKTHLYIMNETHPMDRERWLASFSDLANKEWCGQEENWGLAKPWPNGSWHLCPGEQYNDEHYFYYGSRGHFLGKFEIDGASETPQDTQLAYNPFLGNVLGAAAPMDQTPIPAAPAYPNGAEAFKAKIALRVSVFSPTTEKLHLVRNGMVRDHGEGFMERELESRQDMWDLTNGLLGSPDARARTWRRLFFVGVHKLFATLVVLLTVTYWYTRQTAAGISHASVWMRALVVVPKNIHWLITGWLQRSGIPNGFWGFISFVAVIVLLCISEILQLRLVAPVDWRGSGWVFDPRGTWAQTEHTVTETPSNRHKVKIDANLKLELSWPSRRWSHRERDTMRLEPFLPTLLGTAGTFVACMAFFYICHGYIIDPRPPRSWDPTEQDFLAKSVKAIGWAGFASANLLQLRMNHVAGSFAGTYALVAYMQLGIEGCKALYNFPSVVGHYYVTDGLSLLDASRAVFAAVAAYQALTLPKVAQNVPDDDE